LPDPGPIGIQVHISVQDEFLNLVLGQVGPEAPLADGLLHVPATDGPGLLPRRPDLGLAQDVPEKSHLQSQLLLPPRQFHAVFQQAGQPGLVHGPQPIVLDHPGGERSILDNLLLVPVHPVVKMGLDLEQLLELLVIGIKQMIIL
jgi:hypothetical protein